MQARFIQFQLRYVPLLTPRAFARNLQYCPEGPMMDPRCLQNASIRAFAKNMFTRFCHAEYLKSIYNMFFWPASVETDLS